MRSHRTREAIKASGRSCKIWRGKIRMFSSCVGRRRRKQGPKKVLPRRRGSKPQKVRSTSQELAGLTHKQSGCWLEAWKECGDQRESVAWRRRMPGERVGRDYRNGSCQACILKRKCHSRGVQDIFRVNEGTARGGCCGTGTRERRRVRKRAYSSILTGWRVKTGMMIKLWVPGYFMWTCSYSVDCRLVLDLFMICVMLENCI